MNPQMKTFLIVIGAIFIAGGSLLYGALTAPKQSDSPEAVQQSTKQTTSSIDTVNAELPTIKMVLEGAYPKTATDYTMIKPQLYADGEWFGALLQYKGGDVANRDTLRVLMQKKDGAWTLRTTPPEILLSAKKYTDVPKSVLKAINSPVGLP